MDGTTLDVLLVAAVSIAFLRTVIGVDHFLPFVVLGRARHWPLRKVLGITALCGLGHVLSSVALGFVGIGIGTALSELEWVEGARGSLASWLLIAFGITYGAWAFWRVLRGRRHEHAHAHEDGAIHRHGHDHRGTHAHPPRFARALVERARRWRDRDLRSGDPRAGDLSGTMRALDCPRLLSDDLTRNTP